MDINNPEKKYYRSNTAVYSCQYHVIFCTKYRRNVLSDIIASRFKDLVLKDQEAMNYKIIEMEVMPDHIHLLMDVNPKLGVYNAINHIKGFTSRELRKEFPELKTRLPTLWTRTKFISTCGAVSLETVKKYIEEQKGI